MQKEAKFVEGVKFYNLYELFLDQFLMLISKIVLILHHFQYYHEDSYPSPPHTHTQSEKIEKVPWTWFDENSKSSLEFGDIGDAPEVPRDPGSQDHTFLRLC